MLREWLNYNYGYSVVNNQLEIGFESYDKNRDKDRAEVVRGQDILLKGNLSLKRFETLKNVDVMLDFAMLNFRLPKNRRVEIWGQGKYGLVLKLFRNILNGEGKDLKREFFRKMLNCHEEGIRWAVAALSPSIFSDDPELHNEVASKLLDDNNVWVLREAIDSLGRLPSY